MSEFDSVSSSGREATDSGQPDLPSAAVDVSAGTLLRQAREAAGLHIAALAVSLKVPVKKLEALEADRFELLPDAVFVRALAASVCRTLKIDAAPVLQRLPKNSNAKPAYQSASINAPFRTPGDGPGPSVWTHISRPAVLAGLLLLLGALVLIFLPAVKSGIRDATSDSTSVVGNAESAAVPANVAAEAIGVAAVKLSSTNGENLSSTSATTDSAVLHTDGSAPSVSSAPAIMQTASSPVPAASALASLAPALVAPSAEASAAPPSSATGIVVFRAKGESWVEVTDSKGTVVLRRTLVPGDIVGASGALPLAAVVGRADATEVKIRGKAFELATFAKDNVARFEVK